MKVCFQNHLHHHLEPNQSSSHIFLRMTRSLAHMGFSNTRTLQGLHHYGSSSSWCHLPFPLLFLKKTSLTWTIVWWLLRGGVYKGTKWQWKKILQRLHLKKKSLLWQFPLSLWKLPDSFLALKINIRVHWIGSNCGTVLMCALDIHLNFIFILFF